MFVTSIGILANTIQYNLRMRITVSQIVGGAGRVEACRASMSEGKILSEATALAAEPDEIPLSGSEESILNGDEELDPRIAVNFVATITTLPSYQTMSTMRFYCRIV